MSPLQKIAMGMVIVVLTAPLPAEPTPSWKQYDALPDPLGWLLVIAVVVALARVQPAFRTVQWVAVLAGVVSVALWFPQLNHRLDDSGAWAASLPQLAFCLLLCRQIGVLGGAQDPPDRSAERRFGLLVWGFAVLGVLPVLVLGGGLDALEDATVVVSMLVNLALIWSLFAFHRRQWLGGPGPLEVRPTARPRPRR